MSKHLKLKDFLSELSSKKIPLDILALQETWNIPYPHLIHIPGYNFIHRQRDKIKGGGVGFYIQENMSYSIVENLSPFIPKLFECLSIEVTINSKKTIFSSLYRSPSSKTEDMVTFLSNLDTLLFNISSKYITINCLHLP